jgi:hypothetical protein
MARTSILAPTLLALAPAALGAPQDLELPPGPAERAWAGVGPRTEVPALTTELLPPEVEAWKRPEPWLAWARMVRAEADARAAGEAPDGRRRAQLALIAWHQGRSDDAWDHLAACTAEPGWMAAVVPHLLPGVPMDLMLTGGGAPGVGLPDGVILRPALPPPPTAAADVVHGLSRMRPREMSITRLRVGDAYVTMRVAFEYDGVQVDFTHEAGEATQFWIELPEPPDFEIRMEYLDWTRLENAREPIAIELSRETPTRFVFGRCRPQRLTWSETLPEALDERLARHGLQLRIDPQGGQTERFTAIAAALGEVLGCPTELIAPPAADPPTPWPGVSLRFTDDAERERKLRGLLSMVEYFALRAR